MKKVAEKFFKQLIIKWERGYQNHPEDKGNWAGNYLVGTKYGITPKVYSEYYNVPLELIHPELIKRLTLTEAVHIALKYYYYAPRYHDLPWSPLLECVLDTAYNSGPGIATKGLQRLIKSKPDGFVGPKTNAAYLQALDQKPMIDLVWSYFLWRIKFYVQITTRRKSNLIFLKGWIRRAEWFTPLNKIWYNP